MASEHQAISQHQVEQEETTIDLAEPVSYTHLTLPTIRLV